MGSREEGGVSLLHFKAAPQGQSRGRLAEAMGRLLVQMLSQLYPFCG